MVTVLVLNWGEMHIVRESLNRLVNEPMVSQVVVVDNGSTDGSADYLRYLQHRCGPSDHYTHALLSHNTGPSVARNVGIALCRHGNDIFLLDGDVLYVPGTVQAYHSVMYEFPRTEAKDGVVIHGDQVGCVGYNDHIRVMNTGTNGAPSIQAADKVMPDEFTISQWFPMAWTQYGLFNGDMLRAMNFITDGVFGEPGHGYEDDWLYHQMRQAGYASLAVNAPYYYHDAHYSLKLLKGLNMPSNTEARGAVFHDTWGHDTGWREALAKMSPEQMVPFGGYNKDGWH